MKIGLYGINLGVLADREAMLRAARAAEAANFESLWTGEHVVFVDPQQPPSPLLPDTPLVDTVATLAFLAGATERVRLASGILLLPQRNPVVLAKELAGIDVLSGGRLIFGVGVGSVPGEFDAIGVPFRGTGRAHLRAHRGYPHPLDVGPARLRGPLHVVLRHPVSSAPRAAAAPPHRDRRLLARRPAPHHHPGRRLVRLHARRRGRRRRHPDPGGHRPRGRAPRPPRPP